MRTRGLSLLGCFKKRKKKQNTKKKERVEASTCIRARYAAPALSLSYFLCGGGSGRSFTSRHQELSGSSLWTDSILWRKAAWSAGLALSISAATSYGSLQVA